MSSIQFLNLPVDILVNIFKRLGIGDIYNLILTCKPLKNLIINDNSIWRFLSLTRLIINDLKNNKVTSNESWYNRCRTSHNWCKGFFKNKCIINHKINYMPWMRYHPEGLLLTIGRELVCYPVDQYGFPYSEKILWKLKMPRIQRDRYDIRTDDISRFIWRDNLLVCGNRNGSTTVYKMDNIKSKPKLILNIKDTYEFGQIEVSAVEILNKTEIPYMVTASSNSPLVLFWSWDGDSEIQDLSRGGDDYGTYMALDLEDDCAGVKCLAANECGDKLAIGPDGNTRPVLYDVSACKFILTSDDSTNPHEAIKDIQWHDATTLCYVTHAGVLQMIDIRSNNMIYTVKDQFQSSLYCIKTDGHNAIIAGTAEYSRCVLYDTRQTNHLQLYYTQRKSSPVYSLDFDSTKLIAAVDRGVTSLNFNVSSSNTQQRDYSDVFQ